MSKRIFFRTWLSSSLQLYWTWLLAPLVKWNEWIWHFVQHKIIELLYCELLLRLTTFFLPDPPFNVANKRRLDSNENEARSQRHELFLTSCSACIIIPFPLLRDKSCSTKCFKLTKKNVFHIVCKLLKMSHLKFLNFGIFHPFLSY